MAHTLLRVKSKLVNTPHLIDGASFESILDYVNKRCEEAVDVKPSLFVDSEKATTKRYLFNPDTSTAVMYIDGPLTNKSTGWEAFCGGTSYEALKQDFEEVAELGAKTVAFMASSGGGEAGGMMDSARYMRSLADANGIKIISYVEDLSASACYGLVCMSDEIVSASDAEIGSIGVLIRLMNDSKALEEAGYERTFITAGASKVPFSEDGSFRKEFLEDLQYKVDKLYENFTAHVAAYRPMTVEQVKATEAKTFLAEDALKLGLIDKVMTAEQFYDYLADVSQQRSGVSKTNRIFKMEDEEAQELMKLEEMQLALDSVQTELATANSAVAAIQLEKAQLAEALAAKEEALAALTSQVAAMEEAQVKAKLDSRKASLSAVLAEDKVETTLASLSALDDAAFATVLEGFAGAKAAVEQSALMQELGSEEEGDTVSEEDPAAAATLAAFKNRLQ
jgi:ClpP class serine protease